jgi:hypothetical protein
MRSFFCLVCLLLLFNSNSVSYSQKLSYGIYSGVNFSDIHGQDNNGRWYHKPGPVQGISLEYSFNRYLGIQTGLNFSTIYYESKTYYNGYLNFYPLNSYPYPYPFPDFYATRKMDFSFLRVPLLLTFSIPSAVRFDLKAGLFYSYLTNSSISNPYEYPVPVKNDLGYIFSSVISCPLSDNFRASFSIGYSKGWHSIFDNANLKHGSSEFALGLTYNGFLNKKKSPAEPQHVADTLKRKLTLEFQGGVNLSWNAKQPDKENYSAIMGPSVGFILNYRLDKNTSLQTGISFERKGYSFRDSSTIFYLSYDKGSPVYDVDSRLEIDYIVIPLLLNFNIGKSVFFNTGPWVGLQINSSCTGTAYDESNSGSGYILRKTIIYDDMERIIRDNDAGWIFSGGVSLPLKNNYRATISLRYSTGFVNVFNQEAAGYNQYGAPDLSIRNGTVSFLVGLKIPQSAY